MDRQPDSAGPTMRVMQHWLADTDFDRVRVPASLGRLPPAERGEWQGLWKEIAALRQRAAGRRLRARLEVVRSSSVERRPVRS